MRLGNVALHFWVFAQTICKRRTMHPKLMTVCVAALLFENLQYYASWEGPSGICIGKRMHSQTPPNISTKLPKAWTIVNVSKKMAERMVPFRLLSSLMFPVKKMVRKSIRTTFQSKKIPQIRSLKEMVGNFYGCGSIAGIK